VQPQLDQPRTHIWMLAVQKDLGHNLVAEIDYNGSHSDHLYIKRTSIDSRRSDHEQWCSDSLEPKLRPDHFWPNHRHRRRPLRYIMLTNVESLLATRGIYTFGKSTDDMSSNDNGTANGEAIFNPHNISSQHGLSISMSPGGSPLDSLVLLPRASARESGRPFWADGECRT